MVLLYNVSGKVSLYLRCSLYATFYLGVAYVVWVSRGWRVIVFMFLESKVSINNKFKISK